MKQISHRRTLIWRLLFIIGLLWQCAAKEVRADDEASVGSATLTISLREQVAELGSEGCSLDPLNATLPEGLREGDQIRVVRHDGEDFALFTVSFRDEGEGHRDRIRMTQSGRRRLGYETPAGERLELRLPIILPDMTEERARAEGEFYEFFSVHGSGLLSDRNVLILAPHGGAIETGTDRIARRLHDADGVRDVSLLWGCLGFRPGGGAYERWHITSTAISERSFPQLGGLARPELELSFDLAISIHGHAGNDILIGGAGSLETQELIQRHLEVADLGVTVRIIHESDSHNGHSPDDIVNRYSDNGIQLELPRSVRVDNWEDVADALAAAVLEIEESRSR